MHCSRTCHAALQRTRQRITSMSREGQWAHALRCLRPTVLVVIGRPAACQVDAFPAIYQETCESTFPAGFLVLYLAVRGSSRKPRQSTVFNLHLQSPISNLRMGNSTVRGHGHGRQPRPATEQCTKFILGPWRLWLQDQHIALLALYDYEVNGLESILLRARLFLRGNQNSRSFDFRRCCFKWKWTIPGLIIVRSSRGHFPTCS
jgi:hypothetical protein